MRCDLNKRQIRFEVLISISNFDFELRFSSRESRAHIKKCVATYTSDKSDLTFDFQFQTLTLNCALAPVRVERTWGSALRPTKATNQIWGLNFNLKLWLWTTLQLPWEESPQGGGVRCDLYKRQIKFEAWISNFDFELRLSSRERRAHRGGALQPTKVSGRSIFELSNMAPVGEEATGGGGAIWPIYK